LTAAAAPEDRDTASYAAHWVRRGVADGLRPGVVQALPGAFLFADIYGFTPLAERLSHRGPQGAEELWRLLNDYFGEMLALVAAHQGDTLRFAGDALLAYWPGEGSGRTGATHRAAACALALQERLRPLVAGSSGVTPPSLRVALTQGDAVGALLDSGGVSHALVGGPAIDEVVRALASAEPGESVVTQAAWSLLQARAGAEPTYDGLCWHLRRTDPLTLTPAAEPPAADDALASFVPLPARERLAAGHGAWIGELRQVSILFAQPGGLDQTQADAPARLQAAVDDALRVAVRFQGHVHEVGIDDKGAVLILAFGLPPHGPENTAERGVRAALELEAALTARGHRASIGVTTGLCYCGVIGSPLRRSFAIVGDPMNLAARLMESAADPAAVGPRVLCDASSARGSGARLALDALAPLRLKGKARPVPVFRPAGLRADAARRLAPLVGRHAECEAIDHALRQLAAGVPPPTLLFVGDAGMGKSRLVHELLRRAEAAGVRVLAGGGVAIEAGTPYYAWHAPLVRLLGLPAGAAPSERHAALLARLGPARADRAPLLEAVLPLGLADTPVTAALSGQPRAAATRELLVALLAEHAAAGPGAVVLEDAHWFDPASWALALEVAQRVPNLWLVLTLRPLGDVPPAELQALSQAPRGRVCLLPPLDDAQTLALVCTRLGVDALPPEVAPLVCKRAGGLPLFAEELGIALVDTGVVEIADGRCRMRHGIDPASLALPDTVQGIVTARIDRLAPREALAAKVGSVIGTTFAAELLRDVHPVRDDVDHLQVVLQRLRDADITVLEAPEPEAYAFKHVITRDVVYNLMLFAQRRQLHQAVAEWYESRFGDDRPDLLALLAHHWARAGQVPKAVACLQRSATRTFGMGLGRAACDQGLEAARLLGVHLPTDRTELVELIGAELGRIGELLAGREPQQLLDLPPLADADAGALIGLLLGIMPYAHQSLQGELFALMSLRCTSLTLLHGNGPAAPVVYGMHSIVYRGVTGDSVTANRFAELALELDRRTGHHLLAPVSFIHTWFNQHWLHPVARALPMSLEAAEAGFAAGDVQYGCFNLAAHVVQLAVSGRPLTEVMEVGARHFARNANRVRNAAFHCVQELQFAKALAGLTVSPTSMSDAEHDEARDVASICATDNYNQIGFYFIARLKLHYHFREHVQALACAEQAAGVLPAFAGQTGEFELAFFHGLALAARAREVPAGEAALLRTQAAARLAQLEGWAALCPANFAHRARLLQAELAADDDAYVAAATAAAAAGCLHHEAMAHELRAAAARARGDADTARDATAAATEAYTRWGAHAKVADLRAQAA
jgi:predicted ATPase/class 3 adenylate cyclase